MYGLVHHQSFGSGHLQQRDSHLHPEGAITSLNGIADSKGRVCLCPYCWATDLSSPVDEKHWVIFSVKRSVAATTWATTTQEENPDRTDASKGSHHLGGDQVERRLSSVVVVICDKWDWIDTKMNKSYQIDH